MDRNELSRLLDILERKSESEAPYFDDRLLKKIENIRRTIELIDLESDSGFDGDILDYVY